MSLTGAVSLGTGVMIGAGIFALLGQVAELSGNLFPIVFVLGAIISGFSAYSYVKLSNTFPSAGGIAMYLQKEYGKTTFTAFAALLMAFSMVINESLVARTFGTYVMQLFGEETASFWVPFLGVLLIIIAFLVNISGNNFIEKSAFTMAILKVGGISVLAIGGLWAAGFSFEDTVPSTMPDKSAISIIGALALSILAYKGFTTITNSGGEIKKPHKNVGRAIILSILICAVLYYLVAIAVASSLSIGEIIEAKDYTLAEAARPAFGKSGVWVTVGVAIIATVSGLIASIFAVSRMTAMLTEMKLVPHNHFGMPGSIQKHMLVYMAVIAIILTVLFDLSRIASLGAIFYLVMDIGLHWGLLRNLKNKVKFSKPIVMLAILLDAIVLTGFIWIKAKVDLTLIIVAFGLMVILFFGEKWFLKSLDKN
ncbi:amino acid transporter [Sunxiuqinia dokdonensis]|uniref:Amino acid transporter n=1 Tax=Sunxiuqinia dokdonensis TaxID=1409788 RepID=A0A0L8V5E1_9BACT|nr:amino acid transporter [Sunxiuqinia dokdonensis]